MSFLLSDRALTEDQKAALHAALVDHYAGAQVEARTFTFPPGTFSGPACDKRRRCGPLKNPDTALISELFSRDDMRYAFCS